MCQDESLLVLNLRLDREDCSSSFASTQYKPIAQSALTTRAAAAAGVKVKVQGCSARGHDRVPTRGIL